MSVPLFETKVHVPQRRDGLIARPRLRTMLEKSSQARVTLVSAPAGFGKTTVVVDWLAEVGDRTPVAWVSLDRRDNDLAVFWPYLVASLRRALPDLGDDASPLPGSGPAQERQDLALLINSLSGVAGHAVLVLDDYHVIDSPEVQESVAELVDRLPQQIHLVVVTRADPALPLARLRARGELLEIRAADLRFTLAEAEAYFRATLGDAVGRREVAALEERTEGWVAALQLVALSLRGRDDVSGFVAEFAGDDRYIVDYLVEEVLQRLSPETRAFLLETSVLGRLEGGLCDAVTGTTGGKSRLEELDRANLFLVPLDDRRRWYRYHHLFADVLQARLLDERPERLVGLHRRAADWLEEHGDVAGAVQHALAGGDAERAAGLVELALPGLRRDRQDETQRRWLDALPDEVVGDRPVLLIGQAGALMVRGEVDGVEPRLAAAERLLGSGSGAVVVDTVTFGRIPSAIEMYRAAMALIRGDSEGTRTHALRALELVEADDHVGRGSPAALLGLERWSAGDLAEARRWYAEAMACLERAGHLSDVLGCALALSDMQTAQGDLSQAIATCEAGLRLSASAPTPLRGVCDMHVGMAELSLERGEIEVARHHLRAREELGDHLGLPQNPYRWRVAAARVAEADGDLEGALVLLRAAERLYVNDFSPDVRPVGAITARMLAAHGRWAEALAWATSHGLSAGDDLTYVREYEHLALARTLLAQHAATRADGPLRAATTLLDRLLAAAEAGRRTRSVIETLVLRAVAHRAAGDEAGALDALRRALVLAAPEGQVALLREQAAALGDTLERAASLPGTAEHARAVLAGVGVPATGQPAAGGEQLSPRELVVLRLLGTELSGPEIARELVVSLHTVRAHTKSIYAKLGVSGRRAAVRRGHEMGLLAPTAAR